VKGQREGIGSYFRRSHAREDNEVKIKQLQKKKRVLGSTLTMVDRENVTLKGLKGPGGQKKNRFRAPSKRKGCK